jgi:hypothetical protein
MDIQQKLMLTGIAFILASVFGFVLTRVGKPYNPVVFTIHKYISLFVLVYCIINTFQLFRLSEEYHIIHLVLLLIILLSVPAFITGGLLSAKEELKQIVVNIHKMSSVIIFILSVYLIVISYK